MLAKIDFFIVFKVDLGVKLPGENEILVPAINELRDLGVIVEVPMPLSPFIIYFRSDWMLLPSTPGYDRH